MKKLKNPKRVIFVSPPHSKLKVKRKRPSKLKIFKAMKKAIKLKHPK